MIIADQTEREISPRTVRPAPQCLRARLALEFERSAPGRTILSASRQEPPLRVVRAFSVEDGAALVHLHNVSGGLLGGDALELSLRLGAGAEAQVTTTGATRLYRPGSGAAPASQINEISVGENALLEFVPDAVIPFAGARFFQRTAIHLQSGGGLFWWEMLAPGRLARGEEFAYERIEWSTVITAGAADRAIAAERVCLEPGRSSLSHPVRLGRHRYLATFFICREDLQAPFWLGAEQRIRQVTASLDPAAGAIWSVSTLAAHGLIVRGLAPHGFTLAAGLRAVWSAAKQMLYGREPVWPRKVN